MEFLQDYRIRVVDVILQLVYNDPTPISDNRHLIKGARDLLNGILIDYGVQPEIVEIIEGLDKVLAH